MDLKAIWNAHGTFWWKLPSNDRSTPGIVSHALRVLAPSYGNHGSARCSWPHHLGSHIVRSPQLSRHSETDRWRSSQERPLSLHSSPNLHRRLPLRLGWCLGSSHTRRRPPRYPCTCCLTHPAAGRGAPSRHALPRIPRIRSQHQKDVAVCFLGNLTAPSTSHRVRPSAGGELAVDWRPRSPAAPERGR